MDMSQYIDIFIEEAKEHLQNLNQSLLQLEKNPSDKAMLDEIFRVSHTLKGMAGTMGYNRLAKLTHEMENVLHSLRNNEINVTTELLDLLFKCFDALDEYITKIIDTESEGEDDKLDIIDMLRNILGHKSEEAVLSLESEENREEGISSLDLKKELEGGEEANQEIKFKDFEINAINKAIEMNLNVFKVLIRLEESCMLKSARAFMVFHALEESGEVIKTLPSIEDIEDEKFDLNFVLYVVTKEDESTIHEKLLMISEVAEIIIYNIKNVDEEVDLEKEDYHIEKLESADENTVDSGDLDAEASDKHSKQRKGKTVRVDIDRLSILMNLVSELIIIKTRLEGIEKGDKNQAYEESIGYLERITTSLHDAVMRVRMVPVETVFSRFPRMIRDVSRTLNKDIELVISGEETELDRTVIDEIGDPLIHLLRNSADHGIEDMNERLSNGKQKRGRIYLRAYQDGNTVVIEVEDDGKGINIENVKKKAIGKGLLDKNIANNLSDKDAIDFLFKPSFSTADEITSLSGRGVGLDVVKTKIEALGGTVDVETEQFKGSKFIIRLPLTLAIMQALLVMLGKEKYAIPLNAIKEIININPEEIKYVNKQETILLRNTVVPIVRLDKELEVSKEPEENEESTGLTAVIVKKGDKLSGLLVDKLVGQQEIVIKSLGRLYSNIKVIAGATILGDGNVALILDINSLI